MGAYKAEKKEDTKVVLKHNDNEVVTCISSPKVTTPPLRLCKPLPSLKLGAGAIATKTITIGSDFAGLNAPVLALRLLGLKPWMKEAFVSDADKACQRMLCTHFPDVETVYGDVTRRRIEDMPKVNVYFSTFPCQPFSRAGKQQGRGDDKGRGDLVDASMLYIRKHRPDMICFENVAALFTKFRDEYLEVVADLKKVGYTVLNEADPIYNAKFHGLPQNRTRMIVLAVLTSIYKPAFEPPAPLKHHLKLEALLDTERKPASVLPETSARYYDIVKEAHAKARSRGYDLSKDVVITDIGASKAFEKSMVNCMPCITASRGQSRGFFVSATGDKMTTKMMERCMGFPEDFYQPEKAGVSMSKYGHMVGNSVSVNVFMRLLPSALKCAGLIEEVPEDFWADAMTSLARRGCVEDV
jgi:DNA (cytosine-5)-methyltransferase 1